MIRSITFPEDGRGYIYKRIPEPEKPDRVYREYREMSADEFRKEMTAYRKAKRYWNKHKDDYANPGVSKNLIGRTFTFSDKINIIFGPNGAGKTTILNALAGNALCQKGFSRIQEPLMCEVFRFGDDEGENKKYDIDKIRFKLMKNEAIVDWSGNPVYMDRFKDEASCAREFGDLQGVLFSNAGEEAMYYMISGKVSAGQKSAYIFNKLFDVVSRERSLESIVRGDIERFCGGNDYWKAAGEVQRTYFESHPDYSTPSPSTVLLDEIDQSFDIYNTINIYTDILPRIQRETNTQMIIISHSPIILSKAVRGNEQYNIIPLDEEYYRGCISAIDKIF